MITATECVLSLCTEPHASIDRRYAAGTIPAGITALLETLASSKQLKAYANDHGLDALHFRSTGKQFLRDIIFANNSTLFRGLALNEDTNLSLCLKHRRLLQNIFHPDKSDEPEDVQTLLHIQSTYKLIQQSLSNMHNESPMYSGPTIQTHRPQNDYHHPKRSESINVTIAAGLLGMGFLALLIYVMVPSAPNDAIVRQSNSQNIVPAFSPSPVIPIKTSTNIHLASGIIERQPLQTENYALESVPEQVQVKALLRNLETALESPRANSVLSDRSRPAASLKLTKLFDAAVSRKVFLHDFSWERISDGLISGQGKYMTRFDFGGATPQVIRMGSCQIDLIADASNQLRIRQFFLEDNLH